MSRKLKLPTMEAYRSLEDAALRGFVLLTKISQGDHRALENATSGAKQLRKALESCKSGDIARLVEGTGADLGLEVGNG